MLWPRAPNRCQVLEDGNEAHQKIIDTKESDIGARVASSPSLLSRPVQSWKLTRKRGSTTEKASVMEREPTGI
jgi:hypothetical protein